MRENLSTLEKQLAAREAYLEASAEIKDSDRQRLLAETKSLLQEMAKNGGLFDDINLPKAADTVTFTAAPSGAKTSKPTAPDDTKSK
jgi:hypothetical protein